MIVNDSRDTWETFQPFGGAVGTDTGWGRQRTHEFTDLQTIVFGLRGEQTFDTTAHCVVVLISH